MFQKQGMHIPIKIPELHLWFEAHMYNEETSDQQDWKNGLITDVEEYWDV